jgi:molybdopterin converting factor small subunit
MEMGKIEVRLFAYLRDLHPEAKKDGVLVMPLDKRTDVGTLVAGLKLPAKEISLVMVNGKHQRDDYVLKDGDRVGIFPLIGGG